MLLILPPSESKNPGGAGPALELGRLSFPELGAQRATVLSALAEVAADTDAMMVALKLKAGLRGEAERNREVEASATLPALDRFTGVLFDALDADSLSATQRAFAAETVAIHSALFGLIGAGDAIPAYRLSHDSRLPGLSLKRLWSKPIAGVLDAREGLILDLRSEAYAALGPAPKHADSHFVRVVADDGAGRRRALNHFNKKGKGEFVRAVLDAGIDHPDTASLLGWARSVGVELAPGRDSELELVVANSIAA